MSIFRFSNAGGFGTYQRYNDFLAGNPTTPVITDFGAMFPLGEFTLASAQATIDFTNIPQTYKHLQIRGIARTTEPTVTRGDFRMRANSDSGSNYAWHLLIGDGASVSAFSATSQTFGRIGYTTHAGAASDIFGTFIIDILDYSNTSKNKTFRTLGGADLNGSGAVSYNSDLWMSTTAITSLRLYPSANDFATRSQFALYGVL